MEMKGNLKQKVSKKELVAAVEEDPEEELESGFGEDEKKRKTIALKRGSTSSIGDNGGWVSSPACCQAEKCTVDLSDSKRYHQRHKVCEFHSKSAVVIVAGLRQRFCQQCSRFHEVSEFDNTKRSCRRRLAGHNERRRKSSSESHGEGSDNRSQEVNSQLKENGCRQVMQSGKLRITLAGNPKKAQIGYDPNS